MEKSTLVECKECEPCGQYVYGCSAWGDDIRDKAFEENQTSELPVCPKGHLWFIVKEENK